MLASNNILKPSGGRPVTLPTQDAIIGHHLTTRSREGVVGEGRAFPPSPGDSRSRPALGRLNAKVRIRLSDVVFNEGESRPVSKSASRCSSTRVSARSSMKTLPEDTCTSRAVADKGQLSAIVNDPGEYPKVEVAAALDRIKDAGFHWHPEAV
jgi:DNA-directed RNA polymerase subunit beta'